MKLVSPRPDAVPPPAPAGRNAQSGIRVVVARVRDVNAEIARIDSAIEGTGAAVVSRPTRFPSGAVAAHIEDPEGNTIELVQEAPDTPDR